MYSYFLQLYLKKIWIYWQFLCIIRSENYSRPSFNTHHKQEDRRVPIAYQTYICLSMRQLVCPSYMNNTTVFQQLGNQENCSHHWKTHPTTPFYVSQCLGKDLHFDDASTYVLKAKEKPKLSFINY